MGSGPILRECPPILRVLVKQAMNTWEVLCPALERRSAQSCPPVSGRPGRARPGGAPSAPRCPLPPSPAPAPLLLPSPPFSSPVVRACPARSLSLRLLRAPLGAVSRVCPGACAGTGLPGEGRSMEAGPRFTGARCTGVLCTRWGPSPVPCRGTSR